jgi:hypothetical protein
MLESASSHFDKPGTNGGGHGAAKSGMLHRSAKLDVYVNVSYEV